MDIAAARTWFSNLDGEMTVILPEVTKTGAAHESCLLGSSEGLVEIFSKNNGYCLIVQLPSRLSDLCGKLTLGIHNNNMGITIHGEIRSGQISGPSAIPIVLNRRSHIRRLSPQSDYSISFNLAEPVESTVFSYSIWSNGILELFLKKLAAGSQPPDHSSTTAGHEHEL